MPEFKKSTNSTKKYMVKTPSGKWVHFGSRDMEHYKDQTPLQLYKHLNHNDVKRREAYLARARGIKDKNGHLTKDNPEKSNYYAIRYLW